MARFDVYSNSGAHQATVPFLLDVQSDLLDGLDSRVVIPLRRIDKFANVKLPTSLMPVIQIQDEDFILETPKIGSVPIRILKNRVCSLSEKQNLITAALDFLFQGY